MSFLEGASRRVSPTVLYALVAGLAAEIVAVLVLEFPGAGQVPVLDLIAVQDPLAFGLLRAWYYLAPGAVTLTLSLLLGELVGRGMRRSGLIALGRLHDAGVAVLDAVERVLSWRVVCSLVVGLAAYAWAARVLPFPELGSNPILALIALQDPLAYDAIRLWYLVVPGLAAFGGALALTGAWRVWLESRRGRWRPGRGTLPPWPTAPDDPAPQLVLGELHHPTEPKEVAGPVWLTLPEKGLYTGIAIFGAVGSGKTSACMNPFARQLFTWQAQDRRRRAAGLVLEVKGDFCHDVRAILEEAGREDDYIELGLGGRWQWNPLDTDMDSYSLAYTVATLLNQLFGKSREPFWQQAYTNLVRWIIELHRALPQPWCTLRDVYHCTIDPELFAKKLALATETASGAAAPRYVTLPRDGWLEHMDLDPELARHSWSRASADAVRAVYDAGLVDRLQELGLPVQVHSPHQARSDHERRVEAVARWHQYDWLVLDQKLRTSIIEGVSVFLSIFDLPDAARIFCPPPPPLPATDASPAPATTRAPAEVGLTLRRLPDLSTVIESGKVIALNMPAGASPALARAVGVMLKNAWLQTLLKRPAAMKAQPGRYFRPAVFICDEYHSFATVGEDNPSGDEKSFALTRQARCIPIVATQSISSLRAVLGGEHAWRALLQTLRTRIFLSLSDDNSAELASAMCGKVNRLMPSYGFSEQAKPGFSLFTAKAGGGKGSIGVSKTFREQREPMFYPRQFSLLENCQAIALPYDGVKALSATRLYLKPHYLPREQPYWRARQAGHL